MEKVECTAEATPGSIEEQKQQMGFSIGRWIMGKIFTEQPKKQPEAKPETRSPSKSKSPIKQFIKPQVDKNTCRICSYQFRLDERAKFCGMCGTKRDQR